MPTNKLTDARLRNLKPTDTSNLADGGGLYLHTADTGRRTWRLAYRHGGKQKTLVVGPYPLVKLAEARQARDEAKRLLLQGTDPMAARKEAKVAQVAQEAPRATWREVGEEFLRKLEREGKAWRTVRKQASHFALTLPTMGARPIADIRAAEVLDMLRTIEARGRLITARETRALCSRVFRYGVAAQHCESDPAAILEGALTRVPERHYPAIFDRKEVGALIRAIRGYEGDPATRAGLLLCAYTFLRPGEVRTLQWSDVDLDERVASIPAERMKLPRPHKVPLARQVLEVLEGMRAISGPRRYVLPSLRPEDRPISDNTMNAALRRLGYPQGSMTVHGFRRIASTMLNEMGWNSDWIERQLAHVEPNSVRRAYNSAEYLNDRGRMMQAWADHLDDLANLGQQADAFRPSSQSGLSGVPLHGATADSSAGSGSRHVS
jgi:integrase